MANLYLTKGGVNVFNRRGELINSIEISERPANVTFGGTDGKTLYVTAQTSLYSLRMNISGQQFQK